VSGRKKLVKRSTCFFSLTTRKRFADVERKDEERRTKGRSTPRSGERKEGTAKRGERRRRKQRAGTLVTRTTTFVFRFRFFVSDGALSAAMLLSSVFCSSLLPLLSLSLFPFRLLFLLKHCLIYPLVKRGANAEGEMARETSKRKKRSLAVVSFFSFRTAVAIAAAEERRKHKKRPYQKQDLGVLVVEPERVEDRVDPVDDVFEFEERNKEERRGKSGEKGERRFSMGALAKRESMVDGFFVLIVLAFSPSVTVPSACSNQGSRQRERDNAPVDEKHGCER